MVKKFDGKNSQKCEAVRQAMRRVRRVGSERMPWATFYKEVSRLGGFNNPKTVQSWIQRKRNAMSLKPDWVDGPAKHTGANGPFNGIAFQGVGAATTLEYIQVHMADDDGIEFFGGTAQFKYILTTGISDDNLDWTDGWQGKGQFFVAQQYAGFGDQGIEADNNGDNNQAEPRSMPLLSNLTLVGSPESKKSDIGILLREGTGANIHNAIAMAFEDACLDIDDNETYANGFDGTDLTGDLTISNSILACGKSFKTNDEEDEMENKLDDPWSVPDFFNAWNEGNSELESYEGILTNALDETAPDFTPVADGPAASGAVTPDDSFFDSVTFKGGVDPSNNWTAGWTTSARN